MAGAFVERSRRFFTTTVMGLLLLAVMGAGLFELSKPYLTSLLNLFVSISTLGVQSLRDGIYIEVAKGTYERAGTQLLIVLATVALMPISFLVGFFSRALFRPRQTKDAEGEPENSVAARRSKFRESVGFAIAVFFLLTIIAQTAQTIYIVRAARLIEQLQIVVAPYIPQETRLELASRAALIRNHEDYVRLVNELNDMAMSHGIQPPDFSVW